MSMISVDYGVLNQKGSPSWFSDIYANIPTAGYKGRMFISIDTYAFYRDTGTGWDLIGGPGTGTITGSGTSGQVSYFNGSSTLAGSNNLFWDNTNARLGIGTATPSAPLDIHAVGTNATFNGTGTSNASLVFQNAGASKWTIGNSYSAGSNLFIIYNNTTSASALSIDIITNAISSNGTGIYSGSISLKQNGSVSAGTGYTTLSGSSAGQLVIYFGDANLYAATILNTSLTASRSYTLPNATGTIALTSDITSAINGTTNNLAKFTSANVIGNSGVSDDGTNLTYTSTAKATLLVKAANNTFYGQLAFTNGSNALYGGISYNNSGQYMQFETNTSEWMRLGSDGKLNINNTTGSVGALNVTGRIALTTGLFFSSNLTLEDRWEINGGSSTDLIFTRSSVAERMRLSSAGVLTISALGSGTVTATSGVLSAVSDMNLKIEDGFIDNALDKVLNLKPRYFYWKEESNLPTNIRQLGFYAQEVNAALGEETANTPKNKYDKWGVYDRGIIAMLTKAIQELNQKLIRNNIN